VQLLEEDFAISVAHDGQAGIDAVLREQPDLVLLDLSLPVVDGWEVARRLKADDRTKKIPIVACSAHAMHGDEARAKAAGCDGYVTKPIDEELLRARISELIGG